MTYMLRSTWTGRIHKSYLMSLALCSFLLVAQTEVSSQQKPPQPRAQDELRTVHATRVDHAPVMDGTLNDSLWNQATPITNFLQREPYEGQPPTERTEVRVLYTKHAVYFGITCFDSDPKKIVATELRRDASQHLDDYFEIVIDSSHDRRNAYVFQVNPLGTQRDALITEEQESDSNDDGDAGWDGVWTSEAHVSELGWTATVAIPFSTLNFMKSNDVIWGITSSALFDGRMKKTSGRVGGGCMGQHGSARQGSYRALTISAAAGCS
jgi:Carbohydrate family 9 binding domain-like